MFARKIALSENNFYIRHCGGLAQIDAAIGTNPNLIYNLTNLRSIARNVPNVMNLTHTECGHEVRVGIIHKTRVGKGINNW